MPLHGYEVPRLAGPSFFPDSQSERRLIHKKKHNEDIEKSMQNFQIIYVFPGDHLFLYFENALHAFFFVAF